MRGRLHVWAVLALIAGTAGCGAEGPAVGSPADRASQQQTAPAPPATAPPEAAPPPTEPPPPPPSAPKPKIVSWPIPFPAKRRREMAAYSRRHYGVREHRLRDPKVIVEHVAEAASAEAVKNTFAPDRPDPELKELPNVCSHFVIGTDGTIYQLVALGLRCRHTVGLNDRSFGIEHAGFSDGDVLGNASQLEASLALTRWLRCRYGIELENVIGHNESLSSPYHHERVPRLRKQTHGDFRKGSMERYRSRLAELPCTG